MDIYQSTSEYNFQEVKIHMHHIFLVARTGKHMARMPKMSS